MARGTSQHLGKKQGGNEFKKLCKENQYGMINFQVCVTVTTSDSWVCVARLPLEMKEEEFSSLVASYGRVAGAFLVTSEVRIQVFKLILSISFKVTGKSKGYGMVRYSCSQAAAQARHLLDRRQVNGVNIQVMLLNESF